jgi:hypothetical protein
VQTDLPIRVEARSTASAMALVSELMPLGKADLVRLDDGRWEVQLFDAARTPTARVLRTVETWLAVWNESATTVHIAGRPRLLPARNGW